ncbi:GDSL esterase/lipase At4g26790-like [Aristolochia californica]|uniref:GDSL esterase/lipase At4g26790-like n=1 Tax=Aristolochia californica TaxID=171875 RepID=UPI0035DB7CF6
MSPSDLTFMPLPWLLLLLLLAFTVHARGTPQIPAVIVFGDSSADPGNNNHIPTIIKSNFPPYGRDFPGGRSTGRFCNGRIAADFISDALGIKPEVPAYLDPAYSIKDFATGVSFASAGTGLDNATAAIPNVIPLWKELQYFREYKHRLRGFMGKMNASKLLNDALYVISIGTNDFVENYYLLPTRSAHLTVTQYQDFLIAIVSDLVRKIYHLGGRKFSMTSLPPMGCLPLERTANLLDGRGCNREQNQAAVGYNEKLKALVEELNSELHGARLTYSDVYRIWTEILENPTSFGFENTADGCCATGEFELSYLCNKWSPFTCPDASKYVFWDAFHPTEKAYKIIADHVLKTSSA